MAGNTVGRIGIRVYPDTSDFNEDLKRQLQDAERRNKVQIPVELKRTSRTALAQEVRQARDAAEAEIAARRVKIRVPLGVDFDRNTANEVEAVVDDANDRLATRGTKFVVPIEVDDAALREGFVGPSNQTISIAATLDTNLLKKQLKSDLARIFSALREDREQLIQVGIDRNTVEREYREIMADLAASEDRAFAKVDLDAAELGRQIRRTAENTEMVLNPTVELSADALRDQRIIAYADIEFRREKIAAAQQKLNDLNLQLIAGVGINQEQIKREFDQTKRELEGHKVDLKVDLDRIAEAEAQLAALSRNRVVDLLVRVNQRSLATAGATLSSLAGLNLISETGRTLENFASNLDTYALRFAKVATGAGTLASAGLALTQGILTLGSGLAQLGGYALVLPAAAGAFASFVTVGIAAFNNFADAVGGSAEALEKLPAQAQGAARALRGTWTEMQRPIQEAFWVRMGGVFEDLVENVFPVVTQGLTAIGAQAGTTMALVLSSFTASANSGSLGQMFRDAAEGLKEANQGVGPFVQAIIRLGEVGSRYLPDFGRYLADAGQQFAAWVARADSAGKLVQWIDNARNAAREAGQSIIALKDIFTGLAEAAGAGGGRGLQGFRENLQSIADVINSPTFQTGMSTIFTGAKEAIAEVKDGLAALGRGAADAAPAIASALESTGSVVRQLLEGIGTILSNDTFQTGFTDFFSGVAEGVSGFMVHIDEIASGVGNLGSVLGTVFANALPVIGGLLAGLAEAFESLRPAIETLIPIAATFAANFGGLIIGALQAISGPLTALLDLFNQLPAGVQTAVGALLILTKLSVGTTGLFGGAAAFAPFRAAMEGLPGAATGVVGKLTTAFRGVTSFLGGPWVAAFAGAVAVFSEAEEQSRFLEGVNRDIAASYKDIASAAIEAGEGLEGFAAQTKAMARAAEINNQPFMKSFLGLGQDVNLGQLMEQSGLGQADIAQVLTGNGSAAAIAALESQRAFLIGQKQQIEAAFEIAPSGLSDIFRAIDPGDLATGVEAALSQNQALLDAAQKTKAEFDLLWQAAPVDASNKVLTALRSTSDTGRVTLQSIEGIRASVTGALIPTQDKVTQFASAFAASMNTSQESTTRNFGTIKDTLEGFGSSVMKLSNDDVMGSLVKSMVKADVPVARIKEGLMAFGDTAEEAANRIKFVWGPALDNMGKPIEVLGEKIPKLSEFSTGIREVATALGAAAGINPETLIRAINLGGTDPAAIAKSLAVAGVGFDQIREAMTALGLTGPQAAEALQGAAVAAGQLEGLNPQAMRAFDEALRAIAESSDDATTKASALFSAFDELQGGTVSTGAITTQLYDMIRAVDEMAAKTEGQFTPALQALNSAFDDTTGAMDFSVAGIGDVSTAFQNLSTGAMAAAINAYDRTLAATGDVSAAHDAMKSSIADVGPSLDGLRASLEEANGEATITNEAWAAMLETFGLTPEQIEILAVAQTDSAEGKIANLVTKLAQFDDPAGKTVTIEALTEPAIAELEGLGLVVTQLSDGTWEVTTSADTTLAKEQVEALKQFVTTGKSQLPVGIQVLDTAKTIGDALAGIGTVFVPAEFKLEDAQQKILDVANSMLPFDVKTSANTEGFLADILTVELPQILVDTGADMARAFLDVLGLETTQVDVDAGANVARGVMDILGLSSTQVDADAGANTQRGFLDILGLNGTGVLADAGATVTRALGDILTLNGTSVIADAGATITRALGDIFGLNGTPVEADAGAQVGRALGDITNGLNGTRVTADAGAAVGRAIGDITSGLNGTRVTSDAGANVSRGRNDITSGLNGTQVTANAGANIGSALSSIRSMNGTPVSASVSANVGSAIASINSLNGRTVTVNVAANVGSAAAAIGNLVAANGMVLNTVGPQNTTIQRFAAGGFGEQHIAQIARGATPFRIWAEPETGGEAYIPLSPLKRDRSMKILAEVARQFGYELIRNDRRGRSYANGGMQGITTPVNLPPGVNIENYNQYSTTSPAEIGKEVNRRWAVQPRR